MKNSKKLNYLDFEISYTVNGETYFKWNHIEFLSQKILESIRDIKEEVVLINNELNDIQKIKEKVHMNKLDYYVKMHQTLYLFSFEIYDFLIMRFCNVMRSYLTSIKFITNYKRIQEFEDYINKSKFLKKFVGNSDTFSALSYIVHNSNYFEFIKDKEILLGLTKKELSKNNETKNNNIYYLNLLDIIDFIKNIDLNVVKTELLNVIKIFEKIYNNKDYNKDIKMTTEYRFSNILKYLKK